MLGDWKPSVRATGYTTVGDVRELLRQFSDHDKIVVQIENHLEKDFPPEYDVIDCRTSREGPLVRLIIKKPKGDGPCATIPIFTTP